MKRPAFVLTVLTLMVAGIYLFVSAPPALPETSDGPSGAIPIERVLATVAAENDVARAIYTEDIVTNGQAAGLLYQEDWREDGVDAGPLPALFLREVASSLQRRSMPLGLFLGSDYPIVAANRFQGSQSEIFQRIKQTHQAEFFYAEDTKQHTAMFPDFANVQGCVTCHNDHEDSPKTDWKLGAMMGATTWTYDKATVSPAEYLRILAAVRAGFRDAYGEYLEKVATFENPPEIGERWPVDGYYIPSAEVFMAEFERQASAATVEQLLVAPEPPEPAIADQAAGAR